MRLFIADDSEVLRSRLVEMLSEFKEIEIVGQTGYAQEAIEFIRELIPDVVILDLKLPDGNGINVLKKIKKGNISTKVIIFTNYPYFQYRKKCLEAGAEFFFYKANEFEKLVEVIKHLIQNYKKIEDLEEEN
ncbi:MAG: response regulator [Candidatus Heimdallarchaeaceae archaeon]